MEDCKKGDTSDAVENELRTTTEECVTESNEENPPLTKGDTVEKTIDVDAAIGPGVDAPIEQKVDAPIEPKVDAQVEPKMDVPMEPKVEAPIDPKVDAPLESEVDTPIVPEMANSSHEQEMSTFAHQQPSCGAKVIESSPASQTEPLIIVNPEQDREEQSENITEEASVTAQKDNQVTQSNTMPGTAAKESTFSSALGHIASEYTFSSSEGTEDEDEDMKPCILPPKLVLNPAAQYHRALAHSPSSSSDSESDVEFIGQRNEALRPIEIEDDDEDSSAKPRGPIRAKGEMLVEDLPPIQDLHITVPEEECVEFGKVQSIVEQLVLVNTIPGTAYLNLDTVLFLEKGHKVLGAIFDVIGQVTNPLYCVRFNSSKHIKEKGIEVGQIVYVAPRTEHTQFLILDNLMTIRGSDASWEDDVEPPEKHLDYSDDEEERSARRAIKNRNKPSPEEGDLTKKVRPTRPQRPPQQQQQQQHQQQYQQQSRFPRPRYQGGYQQRNPNPNYDANFQPPFQYSSNHTAWHANYAYPPPPAYYPNPYPSAQYPPGPSNVPFPAPNQFNPHFSSPNYSGQQYPVRNQFPPQFTPPPPGMRPIHGYSPNLPPPSPPSMN